MNPLERIADALRADRLEPGLLAADRLAPLVLERRRALGMPSLDDYATRAAADPAERGRLRERITVPETWLFRYPAAFELLREHWATLGPGASVRAISVACATGAEPFSIAAAARAAGIPADAAHVLAIDPNPEVLAIARSGHLGRMADRGDLPEWARPWFGITASGVTVADDLRRSVRFEHGSAPEALAGLAPGSFDAVFCRNLGIYLSADGRRAIGRALLALLAPGGLLFLGHAERPSIFGLEHEVQPAPSGEGAFAFMRAATPRPATTTADPSRPPHHRASAGPARPRTAARARPVPASSATSPAPEPTLADARAAADTGNLARALAIAERRHAMGDRDAGLLELLGTVHGALGNRDAAERWLRQAVYLNPGHAEALLQLALLADQRGDHEQAHRYRAQAARGAA